MTAIFVSSSLCIKLYGYDFDNSVSTKIYSLDHSTKRDNKIRVSKTIEQGSLIYADVQPEIKLRFCIYEAAYTVSVLNKSNVYDDVVFITKNSRLLKSIYPLNEGTCRSIWQKKTLLYQVLEIKPLKSTIQKILQRASETTYVEEHSQSFMKKKIVKVLCMLSL